MPYAEKPQINLTKPLLKCVILCMFCAMQFMEFFGSVCYNNAIKKNTEETKHLIKGENKEHDHSCNI